MPNRHTKKLPEIHKRTLEELVDIGITIVRKRVAGAPLSAFDLPRLIVRELVDAGFEAELSNSVKLHKERKVNPLRMAIALELDHLAQERGQETPPPEKLPIHADKGGD